MPSGTQRAKRRLFAAAALFGSAPALLLPLALQLALPLDASAQHHPAQHHRARPAKPRTEQAVRLFAGLGDLHHPVSTRNPLAQKFFDQGLTFVYAFNHQEAVRSFERAAELDPDLAIAHWGIALALGPNYNAGIDEARAERARAVLRRADEIAARSGRTTPAERDYIAALKLRFAAPGGLETAGKYQDAMRQLMQRYPDDPDAATLFADSAMTPRAWKLWNADGTPAPGTDEIVATLEAVLARHPDHVGANHLYIHAIEASPNPARGLASAGRLLRLAPAAGHLLHMPAHIYDRVGDHAAAARSNEAAVAADEAYFRQLAMRNPYQGYYVHNLHFLAISYTHQGRYRDAMRAVRAFARRVGLNSPGTPRLPDYLPAPTLINVRFEQWDAVLARPAPPESYRSLRAVWHFGRGMAFAGKGRLDAAIRQRAALAKVLTGVPADEGWGRSKASDVFAVAAGMLDARIALLRNDRDEAIARLRAAAAIEDTLAYQEPAVWYIPPREALADELLAAGRGEEAEQVIRDELARRPNSGRALHVLIAALRAQGKDATDAVRAFAAAWKDADTIPRVAR